MKAYTMSFDGALLGRGFWLYVWRITHRTTTVYYVGRTGDSSSPHASSPFKRIGEHLSTGSNAKANTLARNLLVAGLKVERCRFEMVAVGPIFPEQAHMDSHTALRDKTAALERAVADYLRTTGRAVLGKHPQAKKYDERLFTSICRVLDKGLG